jgi:hypothetical protein
MLELGLFLIGIAVVYAVIWNAICKDDRDSD